MQDIYPGIFLDRQNQPLPLLYVERPYVLDLEVRPVLTRAELDAVRG